MEVDNLIDELVHLFKHTTLGILTLIQETTDIKLETIDASTPGASTVGQVGSVWFRKHSTKSLPEEIQKLVDEARHTLTQENREKFHQLILTTVISSLLRMNLLDRQVLSDMTSRPVDHPSSPIIHEYQHGSRRKPFRRNRG